MSRKITAESLNKAHGGIVKVKEKGDRKEARAEERAQAKAEKASGAAVAQQTTTSPAKSSPFRRKKTTKAFDKSMISGPVRLA